MISNNRYLYGGLAAWGGVRGPGPVHGVCGAGASLDGASRAGAILRQLDARVVARGRLQEAAAREQM
jgi:hypothetical protein